MASERIRGTTPNLIAVPRQLQLNLTPAEKVMWEALRRRQLKGYSVSLPASCRVLYC
ncbi:MAG: hypothetical protein HC827_05255 [Cyanobacteria bacterium RM1_2_2]|nr:hypothetical protein [Cyanobacteria bacterium RM1_2_2]